MAFHKTTLIVLLLILFFLDACVQEDDKLASTKIQRHIGLIEFDSKLDTLGFEVCHEDKIYPYFHHKNVSFAGEKSELVRKFKTQYKQFKSQESGYITIRFIVNCKGESGRFRIIQLDNQYNSRNFNDEIIRELYGITNSLEGWDILKVGDIEYDYIRYITFKIQNGEIIEILP